MPFSLFDNKAFEKAFVQCHSFLSSAPCLTIRKTEATTILTQGENLRLWFLVA